MLIFAFYFNPLNNKITHTIIAINGTFFHTVIVA